MPTVEAYVANPNCTAAELQTTFAQYPQKIVGLMRELYLLDQANQAVKIVAAFAFWEQVLSFETGKAEPALSSIASIILRDTVRTTANRIVHAAPSQETVPDQELSFVKFVVELIKAYASYPIEEDQVLHAIQLMVNGHAARTITSSLHPRPRS